MNNHDALIRDMMKKIRAIKTKHTIRARNAALRDTVCALLDAMNRFPESCEVLDKIIIPDRMRAVNGSAHPTYPFGNHDYYLRAWLKIGEIKAVIRQYREDPSGHELHNLVQMVWSYNSGPKLLSKLLQADPSILDAIADREEWTFMNFQENIDDFQKMLSSLSLSFLVQSLVPTNVMHIDYPISTSTEMLLNIVQVRQTTYILMRAWTARVFPLSMFDTFIMREICRYISESAFVYNEDEE